MKDLIKLYSIYSVSGTAGEKQMCDWIEQWLKDHNKPYKRNGNTLYSISKSNNIFLSAHLDQVSTSGAAAHIYKTKEGYILAYNKDWRRTSLGADDKNGVWIILKMLEDGYNFDWSISESEEIGCVGIHNIEEELANSAAKICLVLDRKGGYDILNKGSGTNYCQALAHNLKNFLGGGYAVTSGTISDTQVLSKYIESVNMSVAYHNPHTSTEYTDYNRLVQIKEDIKKVFTSFVHYPASPDDYIEKISYKSYYTKGGYDVQDW